MSFPYKWAQPGPPFNWLGHVSQTQWQNFQTWYNTAPANNFPASSLFYRIRAQQLRKTAGALEQFYSSLNIEKLAPTFQKATWKPAATGHFQYVHRDDHLPMVAMSNIKAYLKSQLQRQDDSVFHMNHLRNLIEKAEDKAQRASEAPNAISNLLSQITGYFSVPQFSAVLVQDQNDVYPAGSNTPRYRVHELDAPTTFELEQHARVAPGGAVALKEETNPQS